MTRHRRRSRAAVRVAAIENATAFGALAAGLLLVLGALLA